MECPVCLEVFKTPLLLPGCGHTVCRLCAEAMITPDNYLRCPECRLVYQLRQGVKSLPKNVALQRTIDEHNKSRSNLMCEQHPDDTAQLYCKTCEVSICLKCYFDNTIRRGATMHIGHVVDTTDDVFGKEQRLLEEAREACKSKRSAELEYVKKLEETETELQKVLDEKLDLLEKNKEAIVSKVRQTANKLRFTLKGSMAKDNEFLQIALTSAKERAERLDKCLALAGDLMYQVVSDSVPVKELKEMRRNLEEANVPEERPNPKSFLKVRKFDIDLQSCLDDARKALGYQTEHPRQPRIVRNDCVISTTKALIVVNYDTQIRVKSLMVFYKETLYKGLSEKANAKQEITDLSAGVGKVTLTDLQSGTMYKLYCIAYNDFGESKRSDDLWFRTLDGVVEIKTT